MLDSVKIKNAWRREGGYRLTPQAAATKKKNHLLAACTSLAWYLYPCRTCMRGRRVHMSDR